METFKRAFLSLHLHRVAARAALYCLGLHLVAWSTGIWANPSDFLNYKDTNITVSGLDETKLSMMLQ